MHNILHIHFKDLIQSANKYSEVFKYLPLYVFLVNKYFTVSEYIYIYIRLHSNTADKFTWWINTNNHQCVYILIISKFIINIKLSKQRCSVSQLCQAVTCGHWWQLMLSSLLPSDLIWDLSVAPLLVQLTGWTNAVDNFWWRGVPDERIGNIFFWGDIFIFFWFCLLLLLLSRWDYTEAIRGELLVWSDHETQREEASEKVSCCVQPAACRTAETVEINTCCSPSLCCSNRRLGLILCILQNNKSTLAVDFWISYFNFDSQVWSRLAQQQVERRKMLKWISAEAANT